MTGRNRSMGGACASTVASEQAYWADLYEQCYQQVYAYFARKVRCAHDVRGNSEDGVLVSALDWV